MELPKAERASAPKLPWAPPTVVCVPIVRKTQNNPGLGTDGGENGDNLS